ncbi:MAG: DUF975 family protein [Clostridiales bacterium]|nr:DUF975 family protein [Clostridiales bacterium]
MNNENKKLKAAARKNLLGHYGTVIAALFLTSLFTIIFNIPFSNMMQQGLSFGVYSRVLTGLVGSVIVSLISFLLSAGISRIHLQLARGQETTLRDMLYPFQNRPDKYFGYGLLTMFVSFLCELPGSVCLIPVLSGTAELSRLGIVGWTVLAVVLCAIGTLVLILITLSWSMTTFLLLDDTDIRVTDAIRESRRLMKGHKRRLFLMYLSFVAWVLFSILSLMIGLLWVLPYLTQSRTCFYLNLRTCHKIT